MDFKGLPFSCPISMLGPIKTRPPFFADVSVSTMSAHKAGGEAFITTVDQALMRGLVTTLSLVRRGAASV